MDKQAETRDRRWDWLQAPIAGAVVVVLIGIAVIGPDNVSFSQLVIAAVVGVIGGCIITVVSAIGG